MHRHVLLGSLLVLCAGCASEEERACVEARSLVEAQYRQLGAAAAVAVLLIAAVGFLQRRQQPPRNVVRAFVATVVFALALGAAGLLGALCGQLLGQSTRDCGDEVILFSERTDLIIAVVVIGSTGAALLGLAVVLTACAWRIWRSRSAPAAVPRGR